MAMTVARGTMIRKACETLLVCLFVGAISLPLVVQMSGAAGNPVQGENRPLASFPAVDRHAASLRTFPAAFEAYHNDRFGLRPQLIRWNNRVKGWLGVSGVPRVLFGKEGWMFLNRDDDVIEQFRGLRPFRPAELAHWRQALTERRDWLARHGIPYVVVVAPDKHTIYPEYLPDALTRASTVTPLDQLLRYLRQTSDLDLVDLRPALRTAKAEVRLYHRTDTHWNDAGAFVAYRQILNVLRERYRLPVRPRDADAFVLVEEPGPGGDLAGMLALADVYREQRLELRPLVARRARKVNGEIAAGRRPTVVMETGDANLLRAVMFRDSFADALIPFLSEHFARITYVWQPDLDVRVIESEHPDVVIHEIVERLLIATPANPPALRVHVGSRP